MSKGARIKASKKLAKDIRKEQRSWFADMRKLINGYPFNVRLSVAWKIIRKSW